MGFMNMQNNKRGFTLAEMMVVMLVLSLITAAFLPVITRRSKTASGVNLWAWVDGQSGGDIYATSVSSVNTRGVLVGGSNFDSSIAKLLIDSSVAGPSGDGSKVPQIMLKDQNSLSGSFYFTPTNMYITKGVPTIFGTENTAYGVESLLGADGVSGYNTKRNTAIGYRALRNNVNTSSDINSTQGSSNTAVGYLSMFSNTTGPYNTAVGVNSLFSNTTGSYNIGIGMSSLYYNTTGFYNIGMGYMLCKKQKQWMRTFLWEILQ